MCIRDNINRKGMMSMNNRTQQRMSSFGCILSGQEFTIESQPTEYKLMVRDFRRRGSISIMVTDG